MEVNFYVKFSCLGLLSAFRSIRYKIYLHCIKVLNNNLKCMMLSFIYRHSKHLKSNMILSLYNVNIITKILNVCLMMKNINTELLCFQKITMLERMKITIETLMHLK